jgi:hypothetical protein
VRLDHLLSKEHWPPSADGGPEPCTDREASPFGDARVFVTELEGGTLTSSAAGFAWCLVRLLTSSDVRGVERDRARVVVVGTLLGPEGTGDCFFW